MKPYIVRQGEYLAKIAFEQGFEAEEVWEHEKNAALRELRKTPWVLCPGDVLFIPGSGPSAVGLELGASNVFQGEIVEVPINVVFRRDGKPIADEAYRASGACLQTTGTSDGEGRVRLNVPANEQSIDISFDGLGLRYRLRVGHLDPIEEESGLEARLRQLGFLRAYAHAHEDADRAAAIRGFREAYGMTCSDVPDEEFRNRLRVVHGS